MTSPWATNWCSEPLMSMVMVVRSSSAQTICEATVRFQIRS